MSALSRLPFPFQNSFAALARVVFLETKATGYALFDISTPNANRLSAIGSNISFDMLNDAGSQIFMTHPLQRDGLVAFSFPNQSACALAREPLQPLFKAMQDLWAARTLNTRLIGLLVRLTSAENHLIDSKIADRVEGLLAADLRLDPQNAQFEILLRHVNTVLRPGPALDMIEKLVKEREMEVEERRVTNQAKAILQATRSLSEDQAYSHLRTLSRRSRRRLREVAMDVIAAA